MRGDEWMAVTREERADSAERERETALCTVSTHILLSAPALGCRQEASGQGKWRETGVLNGELCFSCKKLEETF